MGVKLQLTFINKVAKMDGMKTNRSTVGKGLNLSQRVEKQRRGKGSYIRRNRYNQRLES